MKNRRLHNAVRLIDLGKIVLVAFCTLAIGLSTTTGFGNDLVSTPTTDKQPNPLAIAVQTSGVAGSVKNIGHSEKQVLEAYGRLPLTFVENKGLVHSKVRYYGKAPGTSVYFTEKGVMFAFVKSTTRLDKAPVVQRVALHETNVSEPKSKLQGMALLLEFLGANPKVEVSGGAEQVGKVHFLRGNDPESWQNALATYREVIYKGVWPGVDAAFRGKAGQVKYEFRVQPGTSVDAIQLAYNGAEGLSLDEQGNLLIETSYGTLSDVSPISYQMIDGRKVPVASRYTLKPEADGGNSFGFAVESDYDPNLPLVIDPGLVYSTYLGSDNSDVPYDMAVDASGDVYLTGDTVIFHPNGATRFRVNGATLSCHYQARTV